MIDLRNCVVIVKGNEAALDGRRGAALLFTLPRVPTQRLGRLLSQRAGPHLGAQLRAHPAGRAADASQDDGHYRDTLFLQGPPVQVRNGGHFSAKYLTNPPPPPLVQFDSVTHHVFYFLNHLMGFFSLFKSRMILYVPRTRLGQGPFD